jgi:hypothetical protein
LTLSRYISLCPVGTRCTQKLIDNPNQAIKKEEAREIQQQYGTVGSQTAAARQQTATTQQDDGNHNRVMSERRTRLFITRRLLEPLFHWVKSSQVK